MDVSATAVVGALLRGEQSTRFEDVAFDGVGRFDFSIDFGSILMKFDPQALVDSDNDVATSGHVREGGARGVISKDW